VNDRFWPLADVRNYQRARVGVNVRFRPLTVIQGNQMHEWSTLTTRLGDSVTAPSEGNMRSALQELFGSPRDDEHPDSWLECGSTDGPLYTMSIFQSGYGIFVKYSDADMSEELISKTVDAPDAEAAFRLWQAVISGRFEDF
jgi:hypothetical protein